MVFYECEKRSQKSLSSFLASVKIKKKDDEQQFEQNCSTQQRSDFYDEEEEGNTTTTNTNNVRIRSEEGEEVEENKKRVCF